MPSWLRIAVSDELGLPTLLIGIQHDLAQWKRCDCTGGQDSGLWHRLDMIFKKKKFPSYTIMRRK
jgi:hypothetical protein